MFCPNSDDNVRSGKQHVIARNEMTKKMDVATKAKRHCERSEAIQKNNEYKTANKQ
jgi:hypothetical protein